MLRRRWIWIPPVVVLAALVLGVGALYAYDATRADVIAHGVTVGGVDVGGLGRDAARAKLRRVLLPHLVRPVTATFRGRSFVLTPARARLAVDVDGMADEAVAVSRRGNFLSRAYRDVRGERLDEALSVHVAYAPAAVASFAKRIKKAVARSPKEAQVIPSATSLQFVPSRNGVGVRLRRLRRALAAQLVSPDAPHALKVPAVVRKPKVTTAELPKKY